MGIVWQDRWELNMTQGDEIYPLIDKLSRIYPLRPRWCDLAPSSDLTSCHISEGDSTRYFANRTE